MNLILNSILLNSLNSLMLKQFCLMALLCFFSAEPTSSMDVKDVENIIYEVSEHSSKENILIVEVKIPKNDVDNHLILRGKSFGVSPQVQNVMCDGQLLKEEGGGTWSIPKNSQDLRWEVPLVIEKGVDISTQQSIKSGQFILLSEASSLPRLERNQEAEILNSVIQGVKEKIPFPKITQAPLFVPLNAPEVGCLSEEGLTLKYFQDNLEQSSKLPNMAANMRGLKWLKSIVPVKTEENFSVCWCGISIEKMGCTGAAGAGVLLVSYPYNGELPLGDALLLYTQLHEAFHQLSGQFPGDRPGWVEESLASYYGVTALQVALPDDTKVPLLIERFYKGGTAFQKGLIAINRAVEEGDRSDYGAFYTKGVTFWCELEKVLQEAGDSLDSHIDALLTMKYDENFYPTELQEFLKLSDKVWISLRDRFLD